MPHLCKASQEKVARDAAKAEERQSAGKSFFRCERCQRISHNKDHLCKPEKVKSAKLTETIAPEAIATGAEASAGVE